MATKKILPNATKQTVIASDSRSIQRDSKSGVFVPGKKTTSSKMPEPSRTPPMPKVATPKK